MKELKKTGKKRTYLETNLTRQVLLPSTTLLLPSALFEVPLTLTAIVAVVRAVLPGQAHV
jgi:hypothetical protein